MKKLKFYDILLIAFLFFLVIMEARSWQLADYPKELRESAQAAIASDFSKGINPYALEALEGEDFPNFYMYGWLYPALIAAAARLTGVSILIVSVGFHIFFKLGACFFMGLTVYIKRKNLTASLLCAALLYPCFWRYVVFGGVFPDAFGMFLTSLLYFLMETGIKKRKSYPLAMALVGLLMFHTKFYFVFTLIGVAVYLFFRNKKAFLLYALSGTGLGLLSIGIVNALLPMYFTSTILYMAVVESYSWLYSLKQLVGLGRYFPIPILLLLFFFTTSLWAFARKRESFSYADHFTFPMVQVLCILPFNLYVSTSDGTWQTYYLQLLMPASILLFGDVFCELLQESRKEILATSVILPAFLPAGLSQLCKKLIKSLQSPAALTLFLLAILLPIWRYAVCVPMNREEIQEWENLYARLDEITAAADTMLLAPELGFYCTDHNLYLLDEGHCYYINEECVKQWEGSPLLQALFPHAKLLFERFEKKAAQVNGDIGEGVPEYVAVDTNWSEFFLQEENLEERYKLEESHTVTTGLFRMDVDIYHRK
ncbi:MAG: hypothetical protein IJU50_03780 [Lachnospiraceae bacterium]|nr:hypothetical protein [Lachnospiraceae bacterium]